MGLSEKSTMSVGTSCFTRVTVRLALYITYLQYILHYASHPERLALCITLLQSYLALHLYSKCCITHRILTACLAL